MQSFLPGFLAEAGRVLIDREHELELALCCFVSGGNLLIEDVPGVGKTTLVKVMARLLGLDFKRVQFTNDLLPSDILGSQVYDSTRQVFSFHKGPIFAQLVLGDELNRASPRTQSAVLQAMDEREVTIEGETHALPTPFFFAGTQNPHEQTGTAMLPESQIDRFLMRIALGSPGRDTHRRILASHRGLTGIQAFDFKSLKVLVTPEELLRWQLDAAGVHVSDAVSEYILDLFEAASTRGWDLSPRASLGLQRASQVRAYIHGRSHALPDDVQAVFLPVVTHRLARFARVSSDAREAATMAGSLLEQVRAR